MIKSNKLVHGVGIKGNESVKYFCGKNFTSYTTWQNMLLRCYSHKYRNKFPTYINCYVYDGWKYYSNFKKWFDAHYIKNYHLDKDILIDGNKIYSPETCCFVPHYLNSLFVDRNKSRGDYPIGVHLHIRNNKYQANINKYGKTEYLGSFDTPEEAHNVWLKAKREYARKLAIDAYMNNEIDERIMNAIIKKAYNLI